MKELLLIALGGALGAMSRFLLVSFVVERWQQSFPLGTLMVNALGSFLIGIAFVLLIEFLQSARVELATDLRALFIVGFLGSLTTFSTFSLETFSLIDSGEYTVAAAYILASVIICLIFAALGIFITRQIAAWLF